MADEIDIDAEIRKRTRSLYKSVWYILAPFAFTMSAAWMQSSLLGAIGFAGCVIGIAAWSWKYYSLSRCPACNRSLMYLFSTPVLYKQCPSCRARFITGHSS